MADEAVMRKFLIEIGYKLDTASQNAAMDAVNALTQSMTKLSQIALAVYTTLFAVDKIIAFNKAMSDASVEAKRLGTTAQSLETFAKAGATAGASIGEMKQAVSTLSDFVKNHAGPAVENWIKKWAGPEFQVHKNEFTGNLEDMQGNIVKTDDVLAKVFEGVKRYADNLTMAGKDGKAFLQAWLKEFGYTERQFIATLDTNAKALKKRLDEDDEMFNRHFKRAEDNANEFVTQYTETMHIFGALYKEIMSNVDLAGPLKDLNDWMKAHSKEIQDKIDETVKGTKRSIDLLKTFGLEMKADFEALWSHVGPIFEKIDNALKGINSRLEDLNKLAGVSQEQMDKNAADYFKKEVEKGYKPTNQEIEEQNSRLERIAKREGTAPERVELKENTAETKDNTVAIEKNSSWLENLAHWFTDMTQGWGGMGKDLLNEQKGRGVGGSTGPGGAGGGGGGGTGGASKGPYTAERAAALIRKAGGTEAEAKALGALVPQESEGNPNAANKSGEHSIGLWQINMAAHGTKFGTEAELRDPLTNAKAALALYRARGNLEDWHNTIRTQRYTASLEAAARGAADPDRWLNAIGPTGAVAGKNVNVRRGVELEGTQPSIMEKFNAAAEEFHRMTGKKAEISDAFRTREQQAEYHRRYLAGIGGIAAAPGTSRHEFGKALDSPQADEMARLGILQRHGLHQPVKEKTGRDPVHIEEMAMMINLENRRHAKQVTQPLGHSWTTINNATKSNVTNLDVGGMQTHIHLGEAQGANIGLIGHTVRQENLKFASKLRQVATVLGT